MKRTKKKTFTKLDTTLYLFATLALVCIFLVKIFGGAEVSHLNMSIEKTKHSISEQSKKNESLTMKVNELTSFENILAVVKENNHPEFNDYYEIAIKNGMNEAVFEKKLKKLSEIKESFIKG